jgi:hypothetical protein
MDCDKWKKNKTINPETNRKVKEDGPIYKNIEYECSLTKKNCDAFKREPTKNPKTGRKLQQSKDGIISILNRICKTNFSIAKKIPTKAATKKTKKTPVKVPTPTPVKAPSPTSIEKRNRLIAAIKNIIGPVLNRGDSLESRIKFKQIIEKHIKDVKPCISVNKKVLSLNDNDGPLIKFNKRIGTESVYGMAYMNMGKGFGRLLKFSCKVMSTNIEGHDRELFLLEKVSLLAQKKICPNMPILYKKMTCNDKCLNRLCPKVTKKGPYYVVVNELADYDIMEWFKEKRTLEQVQSMIWQIVIAIYSFHLTGYTHNDAHLGNFLVHKIKPGGHWHYKVGTHDIYIPNCGYQIVLWDFGLSDNDHINIHYNEYLTDYMRPMQLMEMLDTDEFYIKRNIVPLNAASKNYVNRFLTTISNLYYNKNFNNQRMFLKDYADSFKFMRINEEFFTEPEDSTVINDVPYMLDKIKVL